jgi:stage IV sporulation protein FB
LLAIVSDVKIRFEARPTKGTSKNFIPLRGDMREYSHWSLNWGLWGGVRVKAHASLLVVFVLILYVAARLRPSDDGAIYGLMACGILLASVVIHELGHTIAGLRLGGHADLVVLGPMGGLHLPTVPREAHREVTVAMAGPIANLGVMVMIGPALLLSNISVLEILLRPLYPGGMLSDPKWWIVALKMAFWFNWLMVLVNLIPAAPFDGGRALRSLLWPVMGYRAAMRTVSRSGMLTALVLCLFALWVFNPVEDRDRAVPTWLPLVSMAIFIYFCSRNEAVRSEDENPDEDLFGYDFSQGYTSLERSPSTVRRHRPGPLRRWLKQRREMRERRLRQIEAEEERRFDDILGRIPEVGMDGLSVEERAILNRVSARYRNRMRQ